MKKFQIKDYLFAGHLIGHNRASVSSSTFTYENIDVNAILAILRRNKVPLLSLDKALFEAYPLFFNTTEFKAQYDKEQAEFENLRNEWAKVRKEFIKNKIESMLIKSVGYFPYKSSNLDVLIQQNKREFAESILIDMGYIQLHNVEEPYKTLFRKFSGGTSISVIHLHNKVAWVNPFHDEKFLWARYRKSSKDDFVDIPSPEDSILILTAHWFYEDKEIKLSDIMNISTCLKEGELDWEYIIAVAEKMGWLNGLYFALLVHSFAEKNLYGMCLIQHDRLEKMKEALPMWMRIYLTKKVNSREISLPFRLPKIFGKYLHFLKTLKDKTTTFSRKLYETYMVAYSSLFVVLFYYFNVNIRYQPPMLISISGVDGSGKSTYADILFNILIFCELKTRYCWSRVGSSIFLKPFSRAAKIFYNLRKGKQPNVQDENYTESDQRRKDLFDKSSPLRQIGLFLLISEMTWQYFFKITVPLFFKKVVICDRYIYDTIVDVSVRYGFDIESIEGKLFVKILSALTPKPDIVFLLYIPPEDACSRKEVNIKQSQLVKDQIRLYQKIVKVFNLDQINTDNNTSIKKISEKMIYKTLIDYYGKWPTKKSQNGL